MQEEEATKMYSQAELPLSQGWSHGLSKQVSNH